MPAHDSPLTTLHNFASGCTEIVQRMLVLIADVLLGICALISLLRDWTSFCGEPLHIYTLFCAGLCGLDMGFEFVKFMMETSLDRLQDARPDLASPITDEGLLGSDSIGEGPLGSTADGAARELRPSSGSAGLSHVVLHSAGMRKQKATRRKGTAHLHFWSLVFTSLVSVVFAFFAANDEDCAVHSPNLYSYLHVFSYVYIFRLGAVILFICCRDMKNYEDAALTAMSAQQAGTAMRPLA